MAVTLYLDASVIVALLTDDPLTARADAFLRTGAAALVVSDLAAAEFASVVARRVRAGLLSVSHARNGFAAFDAWVLRTAQRIETSASDIAVAETSLRRLDLALRAPDAIHLAIVQRIGASLVTFDRQMGHSARVLGVAVADS